MGNFNAQFSNQIFFFFWKGIGGKGVQTNLFQEVPTLIRNATYITNCYSVENATKKVDSWFS